MNVVVLDAKTLGEDLDLSRLGDFGGLTVHASTMPHEMAERVADADVLVVNKIKCNEQSLSAAAHLRLICVAATGYDNVDLAYCRNHGIGVANVVGYSSYSVSQVAVAMALSLYNRLPTYDKFTKSGCYTKAGVPNCLEPVYRELYGKVWGVFGYGNIGRRVAAVAEALGCRVLVTKREPTAERECVSFERLCQESDILSLHSPLTDATRGILDRAHLDMMKRDAVLINVARGAVVDEAAVAEAVLEGRLGGFGCDVYDGEPLAASHPYTALYGLDNVILTPHMAWGALEARERCLSEICENIRAFAEGRLRNRVEL